MTHLHRHPSDLGPRHSAKRTQQCKPTRRSWHRPLRLPLLFVATVLLGACASSAKRPVFYPNVHLNNVGQAQAQRDTSTCMSLASKYGIATTKDGEVAKRAGQGAVLGGIGAGAWGLVRGDAGERAVAGAAAGAATGAATGAFASEELSPTYKRFVDRCLRERGYDVIGWE